ncbi:MAG TPA: helix-turn-helix domain-containing protein [Pyrinomonadaceae bacterium]|nr:helix-turn-helix domain-containing protein [Pyrinomonadaceae bacterium]
MKANMTFGSIIVRERRKTGWSQKELAARIMKEDGKPISAPYLNEIEHDRRTPTSDHLIEEFASVLKIKPQILYFLARKIPAYDITLTQSEDTRVMNAFRAFERALGIAAA